MRARWVRAEGLHVTVCFVGAIALGEIAHITARSRDAVAGFPPFTMGLGSAGSFGRGRRAVTCWLGIREGEHAAAELIRAVTAELLPERESRRPRPHVTLARDVRPEDAVLFPPAFAPVQGVTWPVAEVVLFRSQLGPGGSRYDALAQLPLLGHDET